MWMSVKATLQIVLCNLFESSGLGLYKTVITRALEKICLQSLNFEFPDDLMLQIIQKLSIRLYKLEKIGNNDFIKRTIIRCSETIQLVKSKLNSNLESLIKAKSFSTKLNLNNFNESDHIYDLRDLIDNVKQLSSFKINNDIKSKELLTINRNLLDSDYPDLLLIKESTISLNDVEKWVLYSKKFNDFKNSSKLFQLLEKYLNCASDFYQSDELGYSRMILVGVKIICSIDVIATNEHTLLKDHKIGFNSELIEYLILPNNNEMKIAKILKDYIDKRNANSFESLLDQSFNMNTFTVRYASQSNDCREIKHKILIEAEEKKQKKLNELREERQRYFSLITEANRRSCDCERWRKCYKCNLTTQADNLTVNAYEWPLPQNEHHINAVIFELRIPESISNLRDSLFVLNDIILKTERIEREKKCWGFWIENSDISKYALNRPHFISLGSSTKLFVQSHYKCFHPTQSDEHFLPNNGFDLKLGNLNERLLVSYDYSKNALKQFCTFKVEKTYESLGWTLSDTSEKENKIIAEQINCPPELKLLEYIKFGTFRSGHRLQARNLLESLINKCLSFNRLSVRSLICQSLWQVGPYDKDEPTSHADFKNNDYIFTLYDVIEEFLDKIEKKWNDHLILYNLIVIILRAITLNESCLDKMVHLLRKCRNTALEWQKAIIQVISGENEHNRKAHLKEELIKVCLYSIQTFNVEKDKIGYLFNGEEDILAWLSTAENITKLKNFPIEEHQNFVKNLLRDSQIVSINLADHFIELVNKSKGRVLSQFIEKIWPDTKLGSIEDWSLTKQKFPFWFVTNFHRNDLSNHTVLHINIWADFHVNYFPISKLPDSILNNQDFKSFFENPDLEVKPASDGVGAFVTKISINESLDLSYTLYESDESMIIIERLQGKKYQFLPERFFASLLPIIFVKNYSHWYNHVDNAIELKPKTFSLYSNEFLSNFRPRYKFCLKSFRFIDELDEKFLIDIKSGSYEEVFAKFGSRLDEKDYINIFKNFNSDPYLDVNFQRFGINFTVDTSTGFIWSKEHSNFRIEQNQNINTLIGLKNYILLIENDDYYPNKKILVPHGKVKRDKNNNIIVSYDLDRNVSIFTYTIKDYLNEIKAEDSNEAWLYLALLHAFTSYVLPDPFLGVTGTQMALHLLKSG